MCLRIMVESTVNNKIFNLIQIERMGPFSWNNLIVKLQFFKFGGLTKKEKGVNLSGTKIFLPKTEYN